MDAVKVRGIERPDFIANNLQTTEFNQLGFVESRVSAEHMEHYAPIMYQGTKPKKSSKSAPKVGDMFLMPKGKVDGESSEEDQFTLWMGQILEINQNSVVVQWWSCDRFLGEYYPLIDATTVITYKTQHVRYFLRDKNVFYCSLLFIRRCM
jgi:hypothetical protein